MVIVQRVAKFASVYELAEVSCTSSFCVSRPLSGACVTPSPGVLDPSGYAAVAPKSIPSHGSTKVIRPVLTRRSVTDTGRPKSTMNAFTSAPAPG